MLLGDPLARPQSARSNPEVQPLLLAKEVGCCVPGGLLTLGLVIFDGHRATGWGLAWEQDSKGEGGVYLLSCLSGAEVRPLAVPTSALFPTGSARRDLCHRAQRAESELQAWVWEGQGGLRW